MALLAATAICAALLIAGEANGQFAAAADESEITVSVATRDSRVVAPQGIAVGPDGALWFTNGSNNSIGRITPGGTIDNFADPSINNPTNITAGPDGNLWFTNYGGGSIQRITPGGVVTTIYSGSARDIVAGPDGNLWFTRGNSDSIGRITPLGGVTLFPGVDRSTSITVGPDGNLWFTGYKDTGPIQERGAIVGKITTDGTVERYVIYTALTGEVNDEPSLDAHQPNGIVAGNDGTLWVADSRLAAGQGEAILSVQTDGQMTRLVENPTDVPLEITKGPDGNPWFTYANGSIGRYIPSVTLITYSDPTMSRVTGIAAGPDSSVWFTNTENNSIGRISLDGAITNFTGPRIAVPNGITRESDGSVWFTTSDASTNIDTIGRITPEGVVNNYTDASLSGPSDLVFSMGGLWFTNTDANAIGRVEIGGNITSYTDVGINKPKKITAGPDGNVWFTQQSSIGRMTPGGEFAVYTHTPMLAPNDITAGPDGNLWFVTGYNNTIGRITTGGEITLFTDPAIHLPQGITAGPDGNLWFTHNDSIGRITPTGVVTNFAAANIEQPSEITVGPDGNLWFVDELNSAIGRITTSGVATKFTDPSIVLPRGITKGPGDTLFFTSGDGFIGKIVIGDAPPVVITGAFHPMTPARIIDSRPSSKVGPYGTPWGQGTSRDITVAGNAGVPADATGVVLNVTGVTPTAGTYLTIWPKGQSRPTASNLNLPASDIRPNLVMAKLGDSGAVSVYNFLGNTHVVVDVVGWYGSGTDASYFNELSPSRIWDTRPAPENVGPLGKLGQGQTKDLKVTGVGGVPTGATAVVMNVTAVNPSYSTFITTWPKGQSRPTASNLNVPAGDVRPNLVVAKVGTDGKVSFFNNAGNTDLVVDVVGYFADTGSQFNGMTPKRVWDSRPAPENVGPLGKLGQGQSRSITVAGTNGVPADAKAVVVNITGVQPSFSTYLTAWPTGESRPTASNLNLSANTVIPNLAVVKVGSGGKISIFNNAGNTDVVVDIVGWYK